MSARSSWNRKALPSAGAVMVTVGAGWWRTSIVICSMPVNGTASCAEAVMVWMPTLERVAREAGAGADLAVAVRGPDERGRYVAVDRVEGGGGEGDRLHVARQRAVGGSGDGDGRRGLGDDGQRARHARGQARAVGDVGRDDVRAEAERAGRAEHE